MDTLLKIFNAHKGFARMKDLRKDGVQTRTIARAVQEELVEKIKPGLYKLVDYPWDEHSSFADVCNSHKKAVICLTSAADYYGLTTFNPSYITVVVPHNTPNFKLDYPPIQVYYFPQKYYETGIDIIDTKSGLIRIYSKEKTIGDLFRYINKIGEDVAVESLKEYLKNRKKMSIPKLLDYAQICGVRKKIEPLVKAILS
jgi:predicted transcriptional regulator of viral defense system